MNKLKLRNIDLNLLVVFDTIMLERSIARASERLSLSESAVSHALARLRRSMKDELFAREGSRLRPTARARQLAVPVRRALQRLESALTAQPFVPTRAARTFVIAAGDYTCTLLMPALLESLEREAPLLEVYVVPDKRPDVIRQLDDGVIDFVVGWFATVPERFRRSRLFDETPVLLVRRGHPLTRGRLTTARVLGFPHIVVDYTGNADNLIEGFLSERGVLRRVQLERALTEAPQYLRARGRIAVRVPDFYNVAPIVERTGLVATFPQRLAGQMCEWYGLVALPLPFDFAPVTVELIWPRRADADLGLSWFRQHLERVAADLARESARAPARAAQGQRKRTIRTAPV